MLRSMLKRLLRRGPERPGAANPQWVEHAATLQRAARHAEAAAVCRARLEAHPADVEALQMLAAALLAQGQTTEGITCLEEAVAHAPERAELHANLARVLTASG